MHAPQTDLGVKPLGKYAPDLSERYVGEIAENYDRARANEGKCLREVQCISEIVCTLAVGSSILDLPAGTGRFLKLCQQRTLVVTCADISPDMLRQSKKKAAAISFAVDFQVSDARN